MLRIRARRSWTCSSGSRPGRPTSPACPPELAEIVEACLERDPRNRPTSASILARLAPGLSATGELGSAPLAAAALALIEEYRQIPRTPVSAATRDPADSLSEFMSLPSGAGGPLAVGAGTGIRKGTGSPAPVTGHGEEETLGSHPALGGGVAAAGGGTPRSVSQRSVRGLHWRRIALALGSAVAVAALLAAGWGIRTAVGAGAQSLGPVLTPPNGQGPPPGAAGGNSGPPTIGLNQDFGDRNTGFMVHGDNWPANQPVTIMLVGVKTSRIHPLTDGRGTFNYVINQDQRVLRRRPPAGRLHGPGHRPGGCERRGQVQREPGIAVGARLT